MSLTIDNLISFALAILICGVVFGAIKAITSTRYDAYQDDTDWLKNLKKRLGK